MAQAISCDTCQAEPAVLMVTNLGNGDTFAIGPACLPAWCLATAQELTDTMFVPAGSQTAEPAAKGAKSGRRGKAAEQAAEAAEPAHVADAEAEAPAGDDGGNPGVEPGQGDPAAGEPDWVTAAD